MNCTRIRYLIDPPGIVYGRYDEPFWIDDAIFTDFVEYGTYTREQVLECMRNVPQQFNADNIENVMNALAFYRDMFDNMNDNDELTIVDPDDLWS